MFVQSAPHYAVFCVKPLFKAIRTVLRMSFDVKKAGYVYLRYNDTSGQQVNLYVGKFGPKGKFLPHDKNLGQAKDYFLRLAFKNYRFANALENGNPIQERDSFNEAEFQEWKKRQRLTDSSTVNAENEIRRFAEIMKCESVVPRALEMYEIMHDYPDFKGRLPTAVMISSLLVAAREAGFHYEFEDARKASGANIDDMQFCFTIIDGLNSGVRTGHLSDHVKKLARSLGLNEEIEKDAMNNLSFVVDHPDLFPNNFNTLAGAGLYIALKKRGKHSEYYTELGLNSGVGSKTVQKVAESIEFFKVKTAQPAQRDSKLLPETKSKTTVRKRN